MKLRNSTIVILFLLQLLGCGAKDQIEQDSEKLIRLFGTEGDDVAYDIVQTSDEGFLILGKQNDAAGKDSILLLRTDADGNLLWQKHYGESPRDILHDLLLLSDGSFLMAGQKYNSTNGVTDGWIIHAYDEEQRPDQWSQTYGIEPVDKSINNIIRLPDGKLAAAGEINHGYWMLLTNAQGDVIWEKSDSILSNSSANSLAFFNQGSLLVACGTSAGFIRRIAYRLDGNVAWEDSREGGLTQGGGIAIDSTGLLVGNNAGRIIVLQTASSPNAILGTPTSIGTSSEDMALNRTISHAVGRPIVLVGTTTSTRGAKDILIACISPNGNSQQGDLQKYGGRYDDIAVAVTKTKTGYALTGHSNSFSFNATHDIFLMKLDTNGVLLEKENP